ncbi:cytochrome c3 family protein [Anaeromyxobacter paludicola]|uniref:Cytochrome c7-like domain-containing protein n=1 Tax=Anaeromyxobacter paludicola TaxID=2918171 RepID=A0ABM7XF78_9BACT|nr:cytochrome c3 family protein [Anaeromyxobacter paludicola]BDG10482.1 hypothetical protein AMPC_35950 [Anaeromyxobacter paludicola]
MTRTLKTLFAAALLAGATAALAAPPTTVTLPAKNGNVTFDHKAHQTQGCKKCHEGAPKKLELTKETAHKLCWSCHAEQQKGPTEKNCTQCHKKA